MPTLLFQLNLMLKLRERFPWCSFLFPRKTLSLFVFPAVVSNGHCSAGSTATPHTLELVNKSAYFKSTLAGKKSIICPGLLMILLLLLFFNAEMQVMLQDLLCSSSQLCYLITQVLIPYITCSLLTYYISFLFFFFFFLRRSTKWKPGSSSWLYSFPFSLVEPHGLHSLSVYWALFLCLSSWTGRFWPGNTELLAGIMVIIK